MKRKADGGPVAADNLTDVPTSAAYKKALLACRGAKLTSKQLAMLKAHYGAPNHTVTAGELAGAVGYTSYSAANTQYGAYASELCSALKRTPKFQVAILATFSVGDHPGAEFVHWTMLPQVVAALEELRWVRRV